MREASHEQFCKCSEHAAFPLKVSNLAGADNQAANWFHDHSETTL